MNMDIENNKESAKVAPEDVAPGVESSSHAKVLRLAYCSGATVYSMLGLLIFGHYWRFLEQIKDYDSDSRFLLGYAIVRVCLALVQLPVHAMLLFSLRHAKPLAIQFIKVLGKGDAKQGIEKYYPLLTHCNVGLSGMIALGLAVLIKTWDIADGTFHGLEIASISVLAIILLARIYGVLTGKTRQLFYLAW